MDKLLFIGHTYHQKTKSSLFLLELVRKDYQITEFYIDPAMPLDYTRMADLQGGSFDVLIVWQVMPEISEIRKHVSWNHAVFFPMYDHYVAIGGFSAKIWRDYQDFIIISFSRTLYNDLCRCGFDARYIQYFPKPSEISNWGEEKSLFFWQRQTVLNFATLKKAVQNLEISKIHLHNAPDPYNKALPPSAFGEDVVEFFKSVIYSESTWFETKEQLYRVLEQSSLYMAPRNLEGIGMSFLEAMAHGRCVIAPNMPTMSEYIIDGVNGLLYPWEASSDNRCGAPVLLPTNSIRTIQENAYKTVCEGYEKWSRDKFEILVWMKQKANPNIMKLCRRAIRFDWYNTSRSKTAVIGHYIRCFYRLISKK